MTLARRIGQRAAAAPEKPAVHRLTEADRVLTVLPLFHVGSVNIQTTRAADGRDLPVMGTTVELDGRAVVREGRLC